MNMTSTVVDTGSIEINPGEGEFRDELLTFAGSDTFVKGTILARQAVALAVTASAVTGTGTGTVSAATVVAGSEVPLVGDYVLTCVSAVANGGVWKLVDPNGHLVTAGLAQTVGAGAATVFKVGGLQFTITDDTSDFVAGDTATLTVAADGKLVPYNPAGAGGAQKPLAVLTYEVTRTSAGNEPVRPLMAGKVNATRLVIDADGDASNITAAILDELRSAGISAMPIQQLAQLDNT